jgi:hypothetical protein
MPAAHERTIPVILTETPRLIESAGARQARLRFDRYLAAQVVPQTPWCDPVHELEKPADAWKNLGTDSAFTPSLVIVTQRGSRSMSVPTNELLLALRSPTSGWLAAMVCALEEAVQDPSFSDHHRSLVRQLLDADKIPASVSSAANSRLARFEQAVAEMHGLITNEIEAAVQPVQPLTQRPKLTLVGSVAA